MKDYQKYEVESMLKVWLCQVIDARIESCENDIKTHKEALEQLEEEDRKDHWRLQSIEEKKYEIVCAEASIKQILNGGKNK